MTITVVHRARTNAAGVQVCSKCETLLDLDEPAEEGHRIGFKYHDPISYANGKPPIVVYLLAKARPLAPDEYLCHGDRISALTPAARS